MSTDITVNPSPMEIWINIHTYNTYGGNPSLSLVGQYFQLNLPDFGPAINEFDIHVYFRSGNGPTKTLESIYDRYHLFIQSLPTAKFFRKKGKFEINFLSKLGNADVVSGFGPPKLELFISGAHEIAGTLSVISEKLKKRDPFAASAFLNEIHAKLVRLPKSPEEFTELQAQIKAALVKRNEAMSEWDKLGVDWADYHPRAREILDDVFYWDCVDDFAPNGNDTGADVLEMYREWRAGNKKRSAMVFFAELLQGWEVAVPPQGDEFSTTTFAESAVGLAFAQLKLDGGCEEQVRSQALDSLAQQRQRVNALHRDWDLFEERMKTLDLLETKLKAAPELPPAGR